MADPLIRQINQTLQQCFDDTCYPSFLNFFIFSFFLIHIASQFWVVDHFCDHVACQFFFIHI